LLETLLGHGQLWYSSDQQLAFTHTPLGKQASAGACQTNIETEPLDRKYTMGGAVVSCIQFGNHGLKLKTCMESTSVKGAASPCRSHGIGNSLGMQSWIISFSAGDIRGLESWLLQKRSNSSLVQVAFL